ncbi:MAG: N-acetylglucosamine kinase [Flavobacteriia bacterium]|nr:MAG: N-acetylglucosamine kinase [Flavobacteriia bacterium]
MILIADGGSTKADWVALDNHGKELFRTRTPGINPAIIDARTLNERIVSNQQLSAPKDNVTHVYFYGAGCGTIKNRQFLKDVIGNIFTKARVIVEEDMLAAVYAASGGKESIVCILGTGSNSCYYDGKDMHQNVLSLGYMLMDEASANYFGKQLIRDYFYKKMPDEVAKDFEEKYDLDPDNIKHHIYKEEAPNTYLGDFAKIMFDHKDNSYIHDVLRHGFNEFFDLRILPYPKAKEVPVYFIGSIAHYFYPILKEVAQHYEIQLKDVIQRPIDDLIKYHKNLLIN